VQAVRRTRDAQRAEAALDALRGALSGEENLVPFVVACVESDVTLGEVMQAMEDRFGRYTGA
jgi:methylmalonyl-CoA mutase N-terminal domain/subunit